MQSNSPFASGNDIMNMLKQVQGFVGDSNQIDSARSRGDSAMNSARNLYINLDNAGKEQDQSQE